MWKNIVEPGRPQTAVRRMCIACWTPKATHTHSEYVTYLFSTATIVYESALMYRFYVRCLSHSYKAWRLHMVLTVTYDSRESTDYSYDISIYKKDYMLQ